MCPIGRRAPSGRRAPGPPGVPGVANGDEELRFTSQGVFPGVFCVDAR